MNNCKDCGQEVSKSAKRCPNCGKKLKKPIVLYIIGVIITISIMSAAISGTDGKSEKEKFKPTVQAVLQYHYDVERKNISEASAKGKWTAFKLNLTLYEKFEYFAYYYAMYGEEKYLKEYGENDYYSEVKEFVDKIQSEIGKN